MTTNYAARLTVAALAHNEADHLPGCFRSLKPLIESRGVETLIVLDTRADDATERAAREAAGRVVRSRFVNFSTQRNRALDEARGEWVFFVDPDERATPALAREIRAAVDAGGECAAFRVPRRNILFGHEVRHTGWWPDYQVRLLRREACRYDETQEVHEVPRVNGETCTLSEPLVHYNYATWSQFLKKQWTYSRYDALALYRSGRRARPYNMVGQPLREMKRRLVDYHGYRDGPLGLALSVAMGLYTAKTYLDLWKLQRRAGD